MGEKLKVGNDFLDTIPKAWSIKERMGELTFFKTKIFSWAWWFMPVNAVRRIVEAWGLRIPNQPGLHKETLSQKTILKCLLCETENRPKGIWILLPEIYQVPEITKLKLAEHHNRSNEDTRQQVSLWKLLLSPCHHRKKYTWSQGNVTETCHPNMHLWQFRSCFGAVGTLHCW